MRLSFHGAAQGVTGSCHLLEAGGLKILVDCGLYQGRHEIVDENRAGLGFAPAEIDVLLLTHAHLDHCGRIPLLVKQGFRGEIVTTAATRELARLVLLDSAHLQEEEAKRAERRPHRYRGAAMAPLYTVADAMWSFDRFGRTAAYDEPLRPQRRGRRTLHRCGTHPRRRDGRRRRQARGRAAADCLFRRRRRYRASDRARPDATAARGLRADGDHLRRPSPSQPVRTRWKSCGRRCTTRSSAAAT